MTPGEKTFWGIFAVVIVVAVGGFVAWRVTHPIASPAHTIGALLASPDNLPGLMTTPSPWSNNLADLSARLDAMQFPKTQMEGSAMHIHQHADIFVHGQSVTIPAGIGIGSNFFSPIHVHDTTGIIHVESPVPSTFYLGQFFDVWGVKFTKDCIGGYCTDTTNTLRIYVNGKIFEGDPRTLELQAYEEIAIVYGTSSELPKILPATYSFPQGY